MKKYFGIVALLASFAMTSVALAASFANGDFGLGVDPGVFLTVYSPDTTSITNWSVDSGSVDYIGTYWQSPSVSGRSVDLNGFAQGSISQTFSTVVGATYDVTFSLSGNPDGVTYSGGNPDYVSPNIKVVNVGATGAIPQPYSFDTATLGNTKDNMMWETKTYTFVATSGTSTLSFASQIAGAFGPALANVSIQETLPAPDCPAAPSVAAHYLKNLGVKSGSSSYKNVISLVAQHMGPTTDFDGIHSCDSAYGPAVNEFVDGHMQISK